MNRTFRQRIDALGPNKQALLVRRLGENTPVSPTAKPDLLVAFIVGETGTRPDEKALQTHLKARLPDYMVPQRFVSLDTIPRTPNGKVDRNALAVIDVEPAVDGDAGEFVEPRNESEKLLADIWTEVLGLDSVSVFDDFFEVGGDSLISIRILSRAKKAGLKISPDHFFDHPTIAGQAAATDDGQKTDTDDGPTTGPVPLTPIQHWFFERITTDRNHWNQSALFALDEAISITEVERAVSSLIASHDALRLRFEHIDGIWRASVDAPPEMVPVTHIDLTQTEPKSTALAIVGAADEMNRSLVLETGPLVRFALFSMPDDTSAKLLVIAHHLIVDAVSWRLLSENLDDTLGAILMDKPIPSPPKTTSFKKWSARLKENAQENRFSDQLGIWQSHLPGNDEPLPRDFDDKQGNNRVGSSQTVTQDFSAEETRALLYDVPRAFRSQINDALMTALAAAVSNWTKRSSVVVDLEGHGREALFDDVDISQTIGWFTTVFPVRLPFSDTSVVGENLRAVREILRNIPERGIGFGLLRDLRDAGSAARTLRQAPDTEIVFNYLGQVDRLSEQLDHIRLETANCGEVRSPDADRAYLLEVNSHIESEKLVVEWTFSPLVHKTETIKSLAGSFRSYLQQLVAASNESNQPTLAASDFPLADIGQDELDKIAQILGDGSSD